MPAVPVIVTVKALAVDEVHARVEVPVPLAARVTVGELNPDGQVRPAGSVPSLSDTVPAKFWVLVRVIVEEMVDPTVPLGEVAEIVKSPTWTVTVTE